MMNREDCLGTLTVESCPVSTTPSPGQLWPSIKKILLTKVLRLEKTRFISDQIYITPEQYWTFNIGIIK